MTGAAEIDGVLPPPPWRLHPEFVRGQRRRWWLSLLAAAALAFYAQGYIGELAAVARDREVHAAADVTVPAYWSGGHERWGWPPYATEGSVTYQAKDGRPVKRRLALYTLVRFSPNHEPTVSYVAAQPERWVASWAIEQAESRVFAAWLVLVVAGGAALCFAWRAFVALRLLLLAWKVAPNGRVQIAEILSRSERFEEGRLVGRDCKVFVDADDASRRVRATFPGGHRGPLTLPGERTLVLVPTDGSRGALVLRYDLWPLQLADDEVERTVAVLQTIDPGSGWRVSAGLRGKQVVCRVRG